MRRLREISIALQGVPYRVLISRGVAEYRISDRARSIEPRVKSVFRYRRSFTSRSNMHVCILHASNARERLFLYLYGYYRRVSRDDDAP